MPTPEIEEFAKLLVENVRDAAIRDCDGLLQPQANCQSREALPCRSPCRPSRSMRPVCSGRGARPPARDDQGALRMKFVSRMGREVDLTEEGLGELSGWYMGSGGWRAMFSKERYEDDFADISEP